MSYGELMPLYMVTSVESGGFALSSAKLGLVLSLGAPAQILAQSCFFHYAASKLGHRGIFSVGNFVLALLFLGVGPLSLMRRASQTILWSVLVVFVSLQRVSMMYVDGHKHTCEILCYIDVLLLRNLAGSPSLLSSS